ncbi:hypothetical protein BD779DRAFT_519435 [Infundibulicybe gibba]|nr:hypothetical protein BD779DRAFT_519435 [Infundibulicybe gibba]
MLLSNAHHFEINGGEFSDVQGDYNQQINFDGDSGVRGRVHSAMKDYIRTEAFHNSSARHDPPRCYPGTRETAIETISDWIEDMASYCLWMYGPAGTGKSAVAQTVAELLHQSRTLGASYFFAKGSTGDAFFSTLAYQLMLVIPGLDEHVWAMICDDPTVFKKSMDEQLDRLIVQPYLKFDTKPARVVVIIDGLDECNNTVIQTDIIRLILAAGISLPLQFLITSRPEPELRRAFESCLAPSSVHLPLDKSVDPDRDIRHFLCSEFKRVYQESVEIGMLPAPQLPWPSTKDLDQLVYKSSGHFIYAATVVKFVQEDHAHPIERLSAVLQISSESTRSTTTQSNLAHSAAFQALDRLYLDVLRKYRNRVELAQILHAIMYFDHVIWFRNCSAVLDQVGDLETVFGLTSGKVHTTLGGLHSLIDVPKGSHLPRFLHASFTDFLMNPKRSHEFYFDTNTFEDKLAYAYTRLVLAKIEAYIDHGHGRIERLSPT